MTKSEPVPLSIDELRYRVRHGTSLEREMARELIDLRARVAELEAERRKSVEGGPR